MLSYVYTLVHFIYLLSDFDHACLPNKNNASEIIVISRCHIGGLGCRKGRQGAWTDRLVHNYVYIMSNNYVRTFQALSKGSWEVDSSELWQDQSCKIINITACRMCITEAARPFLSYISIYFRRSLLAMPLSTSAVETWKVGVNHLTKVWKPLYTLCNVQMLNNTL